MVDYLQGYKFSCDEIIRYSQEHMLAKTIRLIPCCSKKPLLKFKDIHEYWVECMICGKKSKECKAEYVAMISWNDDMIFGKARQQNYE